MIVFFFYKKPAQICLSVATVRCLCPLLQNLTYSFFLLCRNDCTAIFYNSGLRLCNLFQRIADHPQVISADRCKYSTDRIFHDIGRIQFSTESCLQYNKVTVHFPEIQKSYCRLCLKNCREILPRSFQPGNSFFHFLCQFCKLFFRDPSAVHLNPLQIGDYRW